MTHRPHKGPSALHPALCSGPSKDPFFTLGSPWASFLPPSTSQSALSVPPAPAQLSGWTRAVLPFPETLVPRVSTDLSRVLGRGRADTSCGDSAPSRLPPYHPSSPNTHLPLLPSPPLDHALITSLTIFHLFPVFPSFPIFSLFIPNSVAEQPASDLCGSGSCPCVPLWAPGIRKWCWAVPAVPCSWQVSCSRQACPRLNPLTASEFSETSKLIQKSC